MKAIIKAIGLVALLWSGLGHVLASESGDLFAEGYMEYFFGENYPLAFTKLLAAAEQGDASAQYNLGDMYDQGQGVAQGYQQAVQWYRKAAEQGLAQAQSNLGNMYANGQGIAQDYQQAVQWYRKAAEQGDASAKHNLGNMYAKGQGVAQDYVEAHKWFNLAGRNGNELSIQARNLVEQRMNPRQIEEAQKRASAWQAQHESTR